MRTLFTWLALGAAAVTFATQAQAGATLDRVMEKKAMVVATNSGWPPQSYLDDKPNMLLEISGEITPERMKEWSQSKNNTQS